MTKKFKLQAVLNYRQILEDKARQSLEDALGREQCINGQIAESRDSLHCLCRELDERQRRGIAVVDLMLHEAHIESMEVLLKKLERDLERFRQEVLDGRRALCEASRDKKLLERLKEKFGEEQRRVQNRQEAVLLDEISLNFAKGEL